MLLIADEFATDEQCARFIERMRWPKGARCIRCGSPVMQFSAKPAARRRKAPDGMAKEPSPARYLYECRNAECSYQFAATTGTLFHDTHVPLQKWFLAIALTVASREPISARQMQRELKVSYKTAWYLCHRIREGLEQTGQPYDWTVS